MRQRRSRTCMMVLDMVVFVVCAERQVSVACTCEFAGEAVAFFRPIDFESDKWASCARVLLPPTTKQTHGPY